MRSGLHQFSEVSKPFYELRNKCYTATGVGDQRISFFEIKILSDPEAVVCIFRDRFWGGVVTQVKKDRWKEGIPM